MMQNNRPRSWFVYILECENGSFYTGITDDMARRYAEHRKGTVKSKFTRSFRPVRVAGCWRVDGARDAAQRLELLIKGMDRASKEALAANPEGLADIAGSRGIDGRIDIHMLSYNSQTEQVKS